ncbi:hypothetical protein EHV15_35400 [Paenibacillus oralis]|uniref:RsfA family transcriptional regulator n=1 Tax=Paenibacillus oralis TaxID=2490856 RepID=A0A3P3TAA4_9BACL|nr:hypothetical protein [Paenibacillus oralis]RRJ54862.1 hypothetical protein EHV15_35400 [Paenibacillus oralis]
MSTTRSDAWSEHDDSILAQIVIHHIKHCSTQLRAFDEVGQKLGRTAAACGFRWNSTVRKKNEREILLAKTFRQAQKNKRSSQPMKMGRLLDQKTDFNSLITFLQSLKVTYSNAQLRLTQLKIDLESANKSISLLKMERERLLSLAAPEKTVLSGEVNENYQALLAILQHANQLMHDEPFSDLHQDKTG